jgi:hypothetical protein
VWALIDGRAGSDYERFCTHCLQTLEASYPFSDGRFRAMWGCAAAAPDYAALAAAVLEFEANCDAVGHSINSHKALAPMVGSRFVFASGACVQFICMLTSVRCESGPRRRSPIKQAREF